MLKRMRFKAALISASFLAVIFCVLPITAVHAIDDIKFNPQVSIPGSGFTKGADVTLSKSTKSIGEYIRAIYNYGVGIVGILAAIIIMVGGVVWMTAAGNDKTIGEAKEWIGAAFTGMALVLLSYMLFKTINPDLVNLKVESITSIKEQTFVDCCGGSGGIVRVPAQIDDNGKKVTIEDKPKEIDCANYGGGAACGPADMCLGFSDSYKCVEGNQDSSTCRSGNYCLSVNAGEEPDSYSMEHNGGIGAQNACATKTSKKAGYCFSKGQLKGEKCGGSTALATCFYQNCPAKYIRILTGSGSCGNNLYCCAPEEDTSLTCGTNKLGKCTNDTFCPTGYGDADTKCSNGMKCCETYGVVGEYCGPNDVGVCQVQCTKGSSGSGGRDCHDGLLCCNK